MLLYHMAAYKIYPFEGRHHYILTPPLVHTTRVTQTQFCQVGKRIVNIKPAPCILAYHWNNNNNRRRRRRNTALAGVQTVTGHHSGNGIGTSTETSERWTQCTSPRSGFVIHAMERRMLPLETWTTRREKHFKLFGTGTWKHWNGRYEKSKMWMRVGERKPPDGWAERRCCTRP